MGNFENKEFLVWTQDFSVEIEELDNHHKEMIKLINTLRDAMSSNVGSEKTNELIVDLFNYANYHFGAEEALFLLKDYPFTLEHCEKHLEYRENLSVLRDMVEAGIDSALPDLLTYLNKWWTNHIMLEDKKFSPYLKA
jgi:hemerythrin